MGDIKKLLASIKTDVVSDAEARDIAAFFLNLSQDQVNTLALAFFGIYTRIDSSSTTRQNIHRLLPLLWDRVDETTRQQLGVRYGKFTADNDREESKLARQFLELVSAIPYIPDVLRAAEIETVLEKLLDAHRALNNFYNEPPFARELQRIVGNAGNVPPQISKKYVLSLVEVFLTNGNGVARNAEPIYRLLIDRFDPKQALIAVLSFNDRNISSSLQFDRCERKYRELLEMLKIKVSAAAVKELIDDIETLKGPLEKLKDDGKIKNKVANLRKIIG